MNPRREAEQRGSGKLTLAPPLTSPHKRRCHEGQGNDTLATQAGRIRRCRQRPGRRTARTRRADRCGDARDVGGRRRPRRAASLQEILRGPGCRQ